MNALIFNISGNTIPALRIKRDASPNEYHFHFTIQNEHENDKNQQSSMDAHGGVETGTDYADSSEKKEKTGDDGITEEMVKKVLRTLNGGKGDKNIQPIVDKILPEIAKEELAKTKKKGDNATAVISKLISNLGSIKKSKTESGIKNDEKTEKNVKKIIQVLFGLTQNKKIETMIIKTYGELSKAQKSNESKGSDYQGVALLGLLDGAVEALGGSAIELTETIELPEAVEGAAAAGGAAAEGTRRDKIKQFEMFFRRRGHS